MTWIAPNVKYLDVLTHTGLNNLQADFAALAAGDSGAPAFKGPAFGIVVSGITDMIDPAGGFVTVDIAHGLGTDNIGMIAAAAVLVSGSEHLWIGTWRRPDGRNGDLNGWNLAGAMPSAPGAGILRVKFKISYGIAAAMAYRLLIIPEDGATKIWTALSFSNAEELLYTKMNQLQDNFQAMACAAASAPRTQLTRAAYRITGTTSSLAAGSNETISIIHGLGTDEVLVLVIAKNNNASKQNLWAAAWRRPDGLGQNTQFDPTGPDPILTAVLPGTLSVRFKNRDTGSATIDYEVLVIPLV